MPLFNVRFSLVKEEVIQVCFLNYQTQCNSFMVDINVVSRGPVTLCCICENSTLSTKMGCSFTMVFELVPISLITPSSLFERCYLIVSQPSISPQPLSLDSS